MLFGYARQYTNINLSSEKLKVIYIKHFFVLCNKNDQFKTNLRSKRFQSSYCAKVLISPFSMNLRENACYAGE